MWSWSPSSGMLRPGRDFRLIICSARWIPVTPANTRGSGNDDGSRGLLRSLRCNTSPIEQSSFLFQAPLSLIKRHTPRFDSRIQAADRQELLESSPSYKDNLSNIKVCLYPGGIIFSLGCKELQRERSYIARGFIRKVIA